MLTGKCKDGFEKYLTDHETIGCNYEYLKSIHPSFSWGHIQDYADSIGYSLEIRQGQRDYTVVIYQPEVDEEDCVYDIKTRDEGRKEAIKKFNELVNER